MEVNEIYELLKKYREHRCTPEEEGQIMRWYEQYDGEVEILSTLPKDKLEQLWFSIKHRVPVYSQKRRMMIFYRYAVAIVLFILVGGGYFYFGGVEKKALPELKMRDILPAKGVAVLRLSDGRELPLDKTVEIQEREGLVIRNDASQVLDYSLSESKSEPIYNTITVPVGGEYRVLLSDGSSVRLNSCSSLTYPVSFTGELREVELTGEGYFDITKSDKPFVVKTSELEVRVLGTSFDLSDYRTDGEASVTLVNGKVSVLETRGMKEYHITPGMRFECDKESRHVSLKEVDTDLYISWVKGKFAFEDMRLEDIMLKLNRWYDCTVIYTDDSLRNLRFTGAAEKDRSAEYLLELIETITDVKFEIDGENIIINHK